MIAVLNGIHRNSAIRLLNNVGGWEHRSRVTKLSVTFSTISAVYNLFNHDVQYNKKSKRCGGAQVNIIISLCELILTSSVSFTRRICSLRSWRSLKVDCAVMEYTRAKPWPFFMYKSLIAVNCSYTGENKTGRTGNELCHMPFGILRSQLCWSEFIIYSRTCDLSWDSVHRADVVRWCAVEL